MGCICSSLQTETIRKLIRINNTKILKQFLFQITHLVHFINNNIRHLHCSSLLERYNTTLTATELYPGIKQNYLLTKKVDMLQLSLLVKTIIIEKHKQTK